MKKIALMLMLLTILSKIFGFFREIALSYFHGATNISDAYVIAVTLPTFFLIFFKSSFNAGFIPISSRIEKEQGEGHVRRFTNNILNLSMLIVTIFIVLVVIFAKQIVQVLAPGFTGDTLLLTVTLSRITIFSLYASIFVSVFRGFLHLKNNFWAPAIVGIPMNIVIIIGIALSTTYNVRIIAIGFLVGMTFQAIVLVPFIAYHKFKYKFHFEWTDSNVKRFMLIVLPIFLSVAAGDVKGIVNRALASNIVEGGVSALNYAIRLNNFILGVFTMAITAVLLPVISKMAANNNIKGLKKTLAESVNISIIILLPVTIGAVLFAEEIVTLLFGRGQFGDQAIYLTSIVLVFYSIGLVAIGLRQVFSRAFFAMNDTRTPVFYNIIGIFIAVSLNIAIYYTSLGDARLAGLAAANSLSIYIVLAMLVYSLRKRIGRLELKRMSIVFIKVLIASVIMGAGSKTLYIFVGSYFELTQEFFSVGPFAISFGNLLTVISIFVGFLLYIGTIYFMKIEDVDEMIALVKNRFKNGQNIDKIHHVEDVDD